MSSGNSTSSCNAGSTRLPPECPWLLWNTGKCLEELGFKQYWNLFFGPSSFARKDILSSIDHCEVPSSFALNSFIITSNRTAPWIDVYPFSFTKRNRNGRQCHSTVWTWLCLRNKFPCNSVLNIFKGNGFWRFGYVRLQFDPQEIVQSWNRDAIITSLPSVFDEDRLSRSKTGPIFVFPRIHPLTRDASSLRGDVYSRHRFFILFGPSSASSVMENCPSWTIFKPAWIISDLQEVVRIYVYNLAASFPATPRGCEDLQ